MTDAAPVSPSTSLPSKQHPTQSEQSLPPSTVANAPAGEPLQQHPPPQNQNGDSITHVVHQLPPAPPPVDRVSPRHSPQREPAPADGGEESDRKSADEPSVAQRGDDDADADGGVAGDDNDDNDDDDDDDPFAGLDDVASMDLYELSNYTFGKKNTESKARMWTDLPRPQHRKQLEENYRQSGLRRSVAAVMLVHSQNFPHLLLLQRSDGKGEYALPGGRLRPGETDSSGLQRKLMSKLMQEAQLHHDDDDDDDEASLDIGEKLATFYDLDFSRNYFPYIPRHLSSAREQLNVYHVSLPRTFAFAVPKNLQLVAVPIMEMYNDPHTYGNVIAAIPALLSRYHINLC